MGGKEGWAAKVKVLSQDPDFVSNVRSLGLVMDADNDPGAAKQRCEAALLGAGLPLPGNTYPSSLVTRILVIPGTAATGAVEDLCLASADGKRMRLVDEYFGSLAGHALPGPVASRLNKARLQVYLAGTPKTPKGIYTAGRMGVIDLSHACFEPARQFLQALSVAE